ncbi:MAG: hypothetical protein H6710_24025 [Myxococcales bacterium]|nr:hypothetical protein [Myxococcales bacterium]
MDPWREYAYPIHEPAIRRLDSQPSSLGVITRVIALYDALDFEEGDDPAAELWGDALAEWTAGDDDDGDDDGDESYRGYPAGWLTRQRERIAEEIDMRGFHHPIFPLGRAAYGATLRPLERARVEAAIGASGSFFAGQLMHVDVGAPTLYLAMRREGAALRIRGADHAHRDGAPTPASWETMERAWGNRRFEVVTPWDAFWAAYEAIWRP